jgi:hypothetical protein
MNLPLLLTISITVNILFIGLFLSNFRQWWDKASTKWYNKRLKELKEENQKYLNALQDNNQEKKDRLEPYITINREPNEIMQNDATEIGVFEEEK